MYNPQLATRIQDNIMNSPLTIYDEIDTGDNNYWLPSEELEYLLNEYLIGKNVSGMALRTRSKNIKTWICEALGYPVPPSFKKTQPKFFGQNFDVYSQKANNLQIWNEEIALSRRYVLIKINSEDFIEIVKVVNGIELETLDTTGRLTQKYQANYRLPHTSPYNLLSNSDTDNFLKMSRQFNAKAAFINPSSYPSAYPSSDTLLPIEIVYEQLKNLVGLEIPTLGHAQERNHGALLHQLVCKFLGYSTYHDDGKFPDVKNQLIEVKLQTSPTVDLGLFLPSDGNNLDIPKINNINARMCDVRYAIFYGTRTESFIKITNFYLVTGADFFQHFRQFEGKKINRKIQMSIPNSLWYGTH